MGMTLLEKARRRYGVGARGVIHIGGHLGQEAARYRAEGIDDQLWIEPQPEAFEAMRAAVGDSPRVRCANVACGSTRGVAQLRQIDARGGGMSSLLEPGDEARARFGAEVSRLIEVPVVPLDELLEELSVDRARFNGVVIDVQGFELEVIRGAAGHIAAHVDVLVSEVSRRPLYEGSCLESDLDAELEPLGFARVYTRLKPYEHGDAIYLRRSRIGPLMNLRLRTIGPRVRRTG
ncbi:MAG: FkbM family methyltransferase [Planctomycetota bacterium]